MICELPSCDWLATEVWEMPGDEPNIDLCLDHYEGLGREIYWRKVEGPTLRSQVKTPISDALELRPWEEVT